jgi:hypothetical protein
MVISSSYTWTEQTRGLVWSSAPIPAATSPVTGGFWSGEGQPNIMNLTKRLSESATYAYDFKNDSVVAGGDSVASVSSVVSVFVAPAPTSVNAVTNLTLGTATVSGTQVQLLISGGQEESQYQLTFTIATSSGKVRVGIGTMTITDKP